MASIGLRNWALLALAVGVLSAGAQDTADDLKSLQGTWRGWVVEGKGTRPDSGVINIEMVIKGDTIVARRLGGKAVAEGDSLGEGTFTLKVDGKLKIMDAVRTSTPMKGAKYFGIYDVEGNTLKWCVRMRKEDRPTEFVTQKGQFLMILKK